MPPLERGGTHALETAGETPGAFLRIVLSTVVPIRVSCLKWSSTDRIIFTFLLLFSKHTDLDRPPSVETAGIGRGAQHGTGNGDGERSPPGQRDGTTGAFYFSSYFCPV